MDTSEVASSVHAATERAARHVHMGTVLSDRTRLKPPKRLLLRFLRLVTRDQISYNQAVVDALHGVESAVAGEHQQPAAAELAVELTELKAVVTGQRNTILALTRKIATLENLLAADARASRKAPAERAEQ